MLDGNEKKKKKKKTRNRSSRSYRNRRKREILEEMREKDKEKYSQSVVEGNLGPTKPPAHPPAGVENTIDNLCKEVHNISEKLAEKTHSADSNPQSIHEIYKNGKLIKVYKNYRNTRGYNLQMNGFLHFMFEYF